MATVLILDGNVASAQGLEDYLTSLGFKVFIAHRGDDGFAQALKLRPDLILLDGIMPDKTGLQMCRQFRQSEVTKDTPIILMSSLARYATQQQFARERGATEYVSKPLKIIELGEMVNRYVGPKLDMSKIEGLLDQPAPAVPDFNQLLSERINKAMPRNSSR